jgi:Na+/H+ antiporter NhaD/arsenite permease-like protein
MGTTGAAMLLIRPLIATNQQRKYVTHTILFFIALVANVGGLLTPLGDPPLFMLFLRGAEFMWFMNMLPEWLFVGGVLLAMYYALDSYYYYKKEHWTSKSADVREYKPLRLYGKINLVYLVGVILAVAFINPSFIPLMGNAYVPGYVHYMREIVLCVLILLSLFTTSHRVRFKKNKFSWMPITEVAILFLGIFVTMTPVLEYMRAHASQMALSEPWHFYYATGALSSFLDNTPTAVVFHTLALTLSPAEMAMMDSSMVAGVPEVLLRAISLGSVMFGAMTYIGNGPNFMVKAIAERRGVKMPSFFGYMLTFSLVILLPVYVLAQLIFL